MSQSGVEIETLLSKLRAVNEAIAGISEQGSDSRMHVLARHKDILHDFTQEFRRLSSIASAARDRADLLGGMGPGSSGANPGNATGLLLRERSMVDRSNAAIDSVVAQAYGVASNLTQQKQLFDTIDSKLSSVGAKFPVVNSVLNAVRRRKNRDTVILASVMGLCMLLILIYWVRK